MIDKNTKIKCRICGKIFFTEYYHSGSIEHENYTSDWNMNIMVNRFNSGDTKEKYKQFLDSITLSGNLCNIKDHDYETGMEIFECRLKWLELHEHIAIQEYLERNRPNIPKEFKRIAKALSKGKEEEIKEIHERFAPCKHV